jgi:hypothetical protein
MAPEPLPASFIKNWTITQMQEEIRKGSAWLNDFHWVLRYSEYPSAPFIVSEAPFMVSGEEADLAEAIQGATSLLFFPLCWQATLIGSRSRITPETGPFGDADMLRYRKMYEGSAKIFLVSPRQLQIQGAGG